MSDQQLHTVFLFKLENTARQFRKYKNVVFKEHNIDITGDQWILMKNIDEQPGLNQTELAERSYKEPASVTRILDILEKKGWVERTPHESSRKKTRLYTTKEGKKMISKILPLAHDLRKRARKGITAKDIKLLNEMLDKMYANMS